jgi:hypothetical protein
VARSQDEGLKAVMEHCCPRLWSKLSRSLDQVD